MAFVEKCEKQHFFYRQPLAVTKICYKFVTEISFEQIYYYSNKLN